MIASRVVAALSALCFLLLCSCATQPRTYQPPNAARLVKSTNEVARAVDAAHASANDARAKVGEARERQKEIEEELKAVENVPVPLLEKINLQATTLLQASKDQDELESHFVEADKAKAQVEKDKLDYFEQAQKLADDASKERAARIKDEKSLSWYRWHFWLSWIVAGAGVLICILLAILKFTGRLAIAGAKL